MLFGRRRVQDVTPQEALELHERGAVLVDVREDDEWTAGHAPQAVHIPLRRLGEAADRFTGRQLLMVCRSGNRSAHAAEALAEAGFDVRNVAGGMSAWSRVGLPVVQGSPEQQAV